MKSIARKVVELQAKYTADWHTDPNIGLPTEELSNLIVRQHQQNFDLWHEEDKAREPYAKDAIIAQVKRNIDALNQRRNDMITEIDLRLAKIELADYQDGSLPWNSETLGSIIDRLSIASLKVFHMAEQTERTDASPEHIQSCMEKLHRLRLQQDDLATALQSFIDEIIAGKKQNKLYHQFKMYNDPSLNPKIYKKAGE
ncbi:MAG: DUF4254 domain-containing protein [Gammaproteobacteria bacterium]|nr:DUF4254 domain-containing protein [Gammaproteobacteria bacterium]